MGSGFGSASTQIETKMLKAPDGQQYEFIIATAAASGSYHKAGLKLAKSLNSATAATTDGSYQNMELLEKGAVSVAFVQADVYNYYISKHPNSATLFSIVETERTEHVQLIMRKGGDENDLQQKGAKVFIGLENSGGAGSWRNIVALEDNYAAASVVTGPIDSITFSDLEVGKIDAIVRTSHMTTGDDSVSSVVNNKKIDFVNFDDGDLNDEFEINGVSKPIYEFTEVEVEKGLFNDKEVVVLETKVFAVISNKTTTRAQRAKIADKLKLYGNGLFL